MFLAERLKPLALRWLPKKLLQHARKAHYLRKLRADAVREPDLDAVRRLVRPGDRVVDLGANVGLYTKALSECVGPAGAVIAAEPVPDTFDVLDANVRRLGLGNVRVYNVAVSDADGWAVMEVPAYRSGGENLYEARIVADATTGVRVPTRTLDALAGDGPVAFVKCDVEGHELSVLRGAQRVLREQKPAWLIEVGGDPDQPGAAQQVFELMRGFGYDAYWFDGAELRLRETGRRCTNYFFLKKN